MYVSNVYARVHSLERESNRTDYSGACVCVCVRLETCVAFLDRQ